MTPDDRFTPAARAQASRLRARDAAIAARRQAAADRIRAARRARGLRPPAPGWRLQPTKGSAP
jgi:hypothetical protein